MKTDPRVVYADMIGKRFGRLMITAIDPERDRHSFVYCTCKCDCGRKMRTRLRSLTTGHTFSCGQCGYQEEVQRELQRVDIKGQKFGHLTALEIADKDPKYSCFMWRCKCDCGNEVVVPTSHLRNGNSKSCRKCYLYKQGVASKLSKYHSAAEERLARILRGMKRRCYSPKDDHYDRYGGRGIKICDEWLKDPRNFIDWAMSHGYENNLSIDRIDNDGNYCPENCRWVPMLIQGNNRSNNRVVVINGEAKTASDWARDIGISRDRMLYYLNHYSQDKLESCVQLKRLANDYINFLKQQNRIRKEEQMFNLIAAGDVPLQQPNINFNTDCIFDYMTGVAVRGVDGKWLINGGLGPACAGVQGRAQTFKSAFAAALGTRLSAIYGSQEIIFDSEDAIRRDVDRIIRMAGEHAPKLNPEYIVTIDAKNQYDLEAVRSMIYELGEKKKAMGKDAMITTPFIDPKTNKPVKIYRPNVILIDSYTECYSKEEETLMTDKGLDDGRSKTLAMLDANKKTIILRNLSRYAAEYGIQLVATAHYGSKLNLDPYAANPKFLQWSNQNDSPKGVGSKWGFLTSPLCLVNSLVKLMDDSKQCKYRFGDYTNPTDLSEICILIQRCKNNSSGVQHPFVISQENGLLTDATDYNFLRSFKGFAMLGNNITHQSMFLPKVNMTRNTFRGICKTNPQLVRALQLSAQLLYIQNNWSTSGWPFDIKVEPQRLVDALMSDKDKYTIDKVLNSRGYWLPDEEKDDKEYMSIFDVLEFFAMSHKKV